MAVSVHLGHGVFVASNFHWFEYLHHSSTSLNLGHDMAKKFTFKIPRLIFFKDNKNARVISMFLNGNLIECV